MDCVQHMCGKLRHDTKSTALSHYQSTFPVNNRLTVGAESQETDKKNKQCSGPSSRSDSDGDALV